MSAITSESTPTSFLLPFEDKEASANISTILNRYAEQNAKILSRGSTAYFLTEIVLTLLSTGKVKVYDPDKMPVYLSRVFKKKVAFTDGHFIWLNKRHYDKVQKFHDLIYEVVSEEMEEGDEEKVSIATLRNLYNYSDSIHGFSPYVSALFGLIIHESLHYILKHDVKVSGFISNEQEKYLYNIASDIYINTLIETTTLPSLTDNMLNHFVDTEKMWGNLISKLILSKTMEFEDVVGFFYIVGEYSKHNNAVKKFFKKVESQIERFMANEINKEIKEGNLKKVLSILGLNESDLNSKKITGWEIAKIYLEKVRRFIEEKKKILKERFPEEAIKNAFSIKNDVLSYTEQAFINTISRALITYDDDNAHSPYYGVPPSAYDVISLNNMLKGIFKGNPDSKEEEEKEEWKINAKEVLEIQEDGIYRILREAVDIEVQEDMIPMDSPQQGQQGNQTGQQGQQGQQGNQVGQQSQQGQQDNQAGQQGQQGQQSNQVGQQGQQGQQGNQVGQQGQQGQQGNQVGQQGQQGQQGNQVGQQGQQGQQGNQVGQQGQQGQSNNQPGIKITKITIKTKDGKVLSQTTYIQPTGPNQNNMNQGQRQDKSGKQCNRKGQCGMGQPGQGNSSKGQSSSAKSNSTNMRSQSIFIDIGSLIRETAMRNRGTLSGTSVLKSKLEEIYDIKSSWKKIMDDFIKSAIGKVTVETYRSPNRLKMYYTQKTGIAFRGKKIDPKEKVRIVAVFDTSGSMFEEKDLAFAKGLIASIMNDKRVSEVVLIDHDTNILRTIYGKEGRGFIEISPDKLLKKQFSKGQRVKAKDVLKHVAGGGGTSHKEVFDFLENYFKRASSKGVVVFFTDFYSDVEELIGQYRWLKNRNVQKLWIIPDNTGFERAYSLSSQIGKVISTNTMISGAKLKRIDKIIKEIRAKKSKKGGLANNV